MLRKIISLSISLIIIVTGLILTNLSLPFLSNYLGYDLHGNGLMGITFATMILTLPGLFISSWLGLVLAPFITKWLFNYAERLTVSLSGVPTSDILVMIFGIGIGLILANLIGSPFSRLPVIGPFIPIVLSLVLSVVGAKLALRKHNDIVEFFNRIPTRKPVKPVMKQRAYWRALWGTACTAAINCLIPASLLTDVLWILWLQAFGRSAGSAEFCVGGAAEVADSSDNMKRAKGRRGLDLVHDLQISYKGRILVVDNDYDDLEGVDAKLVRLARQANADIITNDYNLNKVAGIQGVKVLNINELANAIKPVVVAGEEMNVFLVKEGKEQGQAVAYLDDGTMIVVENGRHFIGHSAIVVVTSVLQTSAGRMIFAKTK